jgi:hypothetical protein
MPGHDGWVERRPDTALIIQDAPKPGLFRENLARPPVSLDVVSRNKMSCAESKESHIRRAEADHVSYDGE